MHSYFLLLYKQHFKVWKYIFQQKSSPKKSLHLQISVNYFFNDSA